MRLRLLAATLVGGTALLTAVPAQAALRYDRRCTGTIDTQCYDTDCGFADCTFYDCVLYLDPLDEQLLDVCVGQARSPQ